MLKSLPWARVRPMLAALPQDILIKLRNPACPELVHDFYGHNSLAILARAVMEISYLRAEGKDGNWLEFTAWTGLSEPDMWVIENLAKKYGWDPTREDWPEMPVLDTPTDRLIDEARERRAFPCEHPRKEDQ